MLQQTRGIVLNSIKYSDSSIIVKIYTEDFGLVSYLVRSARGKKSKIKAVLFQPMAIINFIAFHKKKQGLQSIREITQCSPFTGIPYDIKKSSVIIFMAEVLNKSIHEEEQNKALFDFIFNSVIYLDNNAGRVSEFNLYFMMELSSHLGFYPQCNYSENNNIFNLYDGHFQESLPEHPYFMEADLSADFYKLIISLHPEDRIEIAPQIRTALMDKILDYYRMHLNGFNTLNSHLILKEVLQ